jgi:DNA-directed RNA polymerase specialized sigma24 family protein
VAKGGASLVREREAGRYATREDFYAIFNNYLKEIVQLAFVLTRDHEKAQRCIVRGLEDCAARNRVFREWARSWARRTIIQNAIRELRPRPSQSNSLSGAIVPYVDQVPNCPIEPFSMDLVLGLEDFQRFVFVMSVLERYSEHDCSLLLGCSVREIREARSHAIKELMSSRGRDVSDNQHFIHETQ